MTNEEKQPTVEDFFGPVIYSYSRAQAIEDGVLVDLAQFSFRPNLTVAREVGIKFPVAMTSAAYAKAVEEEGRGLPPGQDLSGRLYDVVYMFAHSAKRTSGSELLYKLSVMNWTAEGTAEPEEITLKAVIGPGDTPEPVITIMLPDED